MTDTKALQLYPQQDEIDTLQHRIRDLLPGADKFNDSVLAAFAQISLAHGLDPFIGEIWCIPTKRGPRIRAGIEGHRKAARKQSNYQIRQTQMRGEDRDAHGLNDNQIAAVTEIYRSDSTVEGQAFIPTLGYGIWSPGDRVPATKTPLWVAFKRSEQDALRKAFDLPFVGEANGASQTIPAHSQALVSGPGRNGDQPAPPRLEAAGSARAAAADLYGDWDGEVFAAGEDHPPAQEHEEQIIDATATLISDEPQPAEQAEQTEEPATTVSPAEPPLDQWGRFRSPEAAITWATNTGAFAHIDKARKAYEALKEHGHPQGAPEMAQLWVADVTYRLDVAKEQLAAAEI